MLMESRECAAAAAGQSTEGGSRRERLIGQGIKFERIRRITGYLVGSLDRWNDSKKAEEHDRVKHI